MSKASHMHKTETMVQKLKWPVLFIFICFDLISIIFFFELKLSSLSPITIPPSATTTLTDAPSVDAEPSEPIEEFVREPTIALINVHLEKKDKDSWERTTVEDNCVGLYTFILTHSTHKMDLLYFHNHKKALPCGKIIKTYEGTNVRFIKITNEWFHNSIQEKLRVNISKYWGKKGGNVNTAICDLKPLYGHIFEEYVKDYTFWGYGDIDGLFGKTETLFRHSLYTKYDVISGYCNTNNDQKSPTYHQCGRGYASGPLTLMRTNITRHILDVAMFRWWREYFKVPKKFFIDEDYVPPQLRRNRKHTLHTILRDHEIPHDLRQYCEDSCKATSESNELFIFNLNIEFTEHANITYRYSKKNGITIWANQTNTTELTTIFRPHFLHWSLWKYIDQASTRKLRRQIFYNIKEFDCFEFKSLSYNRFFRGGFKQCFE